MLGGNVMKNLGEEHEELMRLLEEVPGVTEHLNSFEVQMGKKILVKRLQAGLTQEQVVDLLSRHAEPITRETLSKAETGSKSVGKNIYNAILQALGDVPEC